MAVTSIQIDTILPDTRANLVRYMLPKTTDYAIQGNINIYELAHKCKEWALCKGYRLESSTFHPNDGGKPYCAVGAYVRTEHCSNDDTEIGAIFKACEWILQQRTTNVQTT